MLLNDQSKPILENGMTYLKPLIYSVTVSEENASFLFE